MKKLIYILMLMSGVSFAHAAKQWTIWMNHFMYLNKVQTTCAIKYDDNLKSIVMQIDFFSPDAEGTVEATPSTGKTFRLVQSENPAFFSYVKGVMDNVLMGLRDIYSGANTAYGFYSLYYDSNDSVTNIRILGIKTRTYKQ